MNKGDIDQLRSFNGCYADYVEQLQQQVKWLGGNLEVVCAERDTLAEDFNSSENELLDVKKELSHVKANNANLTERNRILRCRPDLPVDRLPHITKLDDLEKQVKSMRLMRDDYGKAVRERDELITSLKARIDGGVRGYVFMSGNDTLSQFVLDDKTSCDKFNAVLILDDGVEL